jgi:hypothetical protein
LFIADVDAKCIFMMTVVMDAVFFNWFFGRFGGPGLSTFPCPVVDRSVCWFAQILPADESSKGVLRHTGAGSGVATEPVANL